MCCSAVVVTNFELASDDDTSLSTDMGRIIDLGVCGFGVVGGNVGVLIDVVDFRVTGCETGIRNGFSIWRSAFNHSETCASLCW